LTPVSPLVPTLDDVARVAGVSTATVSRCLNEKDKVAEATRKRVLDAVEQLGYTPNFSARAMAAKRTQIIGAIIPTMENAIFARGLQAFQETLHELGYNLLVSSSAYRPELEAEQIKALVARGADGLLLIGHERKQEIYDFLDKRRVPTVLAWSYPAHLDEGTVDQGRGALAQANQACVGFDNRASMRMLADRVIAMGHSRIGVISGILDGNDRAADRWAGIQDSWQAHGCDPDALNIVECPYDLDRGAIAFAQLMDGASKPSAIMCGNDVLAAGALSQARAMGLDVPRDVSVTGFDDINLAGFLNPPLTTVHVPHREMGQIAARALVQLIEDKGAPPMRHRLDIALTMRASLGAV